MTEAQWKTALFTIGIFSLGAVAIILYQHSLHTGQIVGAINAASANTRASVPNSAPPGMPASKAGTPTWGADLFVSTPPVVPMQIGGTLH